MDMIKVGPVGLGHGTNWDLIGRGQIAGICVYYSKNRVFSLEFLYYENGKLVKSKKFGYQSDNRCHFSAVVFDYSSEFMKGCFGGSYDYLITISFGTNKGSYGPFGCTSTGDRDYDFNFQLGNGRLFGGFHGRCTDSAIVSIGIYVKPLKDPQVKDEKD